MFVASNEAADSCTIKPRGDNIFAAVWYASLVPRCLMMTLGQFMCENYMCKCTNQSLCTHWVALIIYCKKICQPYILTNLQPSVTNIGLKNRLNL